MKFKLFLLFLILFSSILAVLAFEIPENYTVVNSSDNFSLLQSDEYHTISISHVNVDKDLLKYLLEDSMYDFTYVDNYTKGDWNIEENWYNQEYQRGILYICDNGEEQIVIDYKGPVIEDLSDSPVGVILDSL